MITAKYYKNKKELYVEGHANSAEFGHDLVCAASSILANTFLNNAKKLQKEERLTIAKEDIDSGAFDVKVTPRTKIDESICDIVFLSVLTGYEILAKNFPEFLTYEVITS